MTDDTETYLYRHYDENGTLLYVGVSLSAINRLGQHKDHSHWFRQIATIKIETFQTRKEALNAEQDAIRQELPKYNVIHSRLAEVAATKEAERAKITVASGFENFCSKFTKAVSVKPFYTEDELANALGIKRADARVLIERNKIGAVVFADKGSTTRNGCPRKYVKYGVTGWQLIEFLEHVQQDKMWPFAKGDQ